MAKIDLQVGRETVRKVPFTFSTAFPLVLQQVAVGSIVTEVSCTVTTPFNGATTARIGTTASPSLVFLASELLLGSENQFNNHNTIIFTTSDFLVFSATLVGCTQGEGLLVYKYRI